MGQRSISSSRSHYSHHDAMTESTFSSSSFDTVPPPLSPISTTSSSSYASLSSVLVLGSSSLTGVEILRYLGHDENVSSVHAFCNNKYNDLSLLDMSLCETIHQGDARDVADVEAALIKSRANWVVVAESQDEVGCCKSNKSVSKQTQKKSKQSPNQRMPQPQDHSSNSLKVRTASAEAIVEVLLKPEFHHVKAVVISSAGAGSSKPGLLSLKLSLRSRAALKDHTGQERAFAAIRHRAVVVRPTLQLTTNQATGKLGIYPDGTKRPPSRTTDRRDLAAWIACEITGRSKTNHSGWAVNIASVER